LIFATMINEANVTSSACRLWRIFQVETSAPPSDNSPTVAALAIPVKRLLIRLAAGFTSVSGGIGKMNFSFRNRVETA